MPVNSSEAIGELKVRECHELRFLEEFTEEL
jgi:hypothetical protein